MSTLAVSEVRQRFDAALQAAGYKRSKFVPELFGYDVDNLVHHSYSIGCPGTELRTFDGGSNVPVPDEGEAVTLVRIRTAHRLRADNQSADYGLGLDHEQAVLMAALTLDGQYLHVESPGAGALTRVITDTTEWMISTINLRVFHRFSFYQEP